jgi:hypothetical protein
MIYPTQWCNNIKDSLIFENKFSRVLLKIDSQEIKFIPYYAFQLSLGTIIVRYH